MIKSQYKISFVVFLFAGLLLLQSCSDFLEQEPGTKISITEQLSTKQGVLTALNGVYSNLEANLRGERFAVYADLQGGNLKFSPNKVTSSSKGVIAIPTNIANVYSFDDQSADSDFESFYNESYDIINQCNLILEFTDALTDAGTTEKNQIKAEALTIRAYTHFLLAEVYSQNYGYTENASHFGIIYKTKSILQGLEYPARKTAAETYSLIISDLKNALELYSSSSFLTGPSYSFFSAASTKALLARVYLSKHDWQNAYDIADDVIKNSGVNLVATENYLAEWEKPNVPISEVLLEFSIPKDASGAIGGSLSAFFGYVNTTSYGDYVASQDLLGLYGTSDIRKNLFLVQPLSTLVNDVQVNRNYSFTKKFQDNPGYVAFRLSEQYLIRAEAALKLQNINQAKTDINIIRARANATLLSDSENLEEALFLERRKELCFEGHLFFDIARNKKNVQRNDGCISNNCQMNYPSLKYVLPIPLANKNLNSNLVQNESYN
ncbi:RagB/SusD family nutrient uptake outer membrane protein [Flavobacterium sp. MAHUQ-51]|uniref:RagB/SusD family nutrient uptake outer membrane protein n=1 Tax=Flavobacterium sp. GCM10022190 TaxID=3252639 RepID=UPI003620436E